MGIITHDFRKNFNRKYWTIMTRWPGTKVLLQTNWPHWQDRASKYALLVNPLNQIYGQSIYFHSTTLVSLLLIQNAFTVIFSISEVSVLGQANHRSQLRAEPWASGQDCFSFHMPLLRMALLHASPPHQASAEIFISCKEVKSTMVYFSHSKTWCISKTYASKC